MGVGHGECSTSLAWKEGPTDVKNEIQYVLDLREKLHTLGWLKMKNLLQAQECQSHIYNRGTQSREFAPGEKVLLLLPISNSKLLAKWQGPFVVTRWVGEADYEVVQPDRAGARQIYHLNLLKPWREEGSVQLATTVLDPTLDPVLTLTSTWANSYRIIVLHIHYDIKNLAIW